MDMILDETNIVKKINLAMNVKAGTGAPTHTNRRNHGFALRTKGKSTFLFDGTSFMELHAGEIIYLPRCSNYVVKDVIPGDYYAINFELTTDKTFPPQIWNVHKNNRVYDIFKTAQTIWLTGYTGKQFQLISLLYELMYALSMLCSPHPTQRKYAKILPAIDAINTSYSDPQISIAQLSNLCNVSDTYFRRMFEELYQTTPLKYITQKRMELAKQLLLSGMYQANHVQRICGYTDYTVFSRAFKAYTGCSPAQYVKNNLASPQEKPL